MRGDRDRDRRVDPRQLLDRDRVRERVGCRRRRTPRGSACPSARARRARRRARTGSGARGRAPRRRARPSARAKSRTVLRTSSCSSVRSKFTRSAASPARRSGGRRSRCRPSARGSRCAPASRSAVPAMSTCAHGPSPTNSCEERRGVGRLRLAADGRVLHVREGGVDKRAVAPVHRPRPGVVAARLARRDDLVAPRVVVPITPA